MATGGSVASGGSDPEGGTSTGQGGEAGSAGGGSGLEYSLDSLGCKGQEKAGGFYGQCCFKALCYESDECLPADAVELRENLSGFPPGSGSCVCEVADQPALTGPFAPNPADPEMTSGNCCYVVGGIGCEGRPLLIHGVPRVARVVLRSDWGVV
jgi:hypothetical protein